MLPEAFLERMKRQLGDEYESYLDSLNRSRAVALRFNPLKGEIPQLPFVGQPVPWEPMGYYYDPDARPGLHVFHEAGVYYLQEASAMAPVALLDPQPGERVCDLCAAPGGKSFAMAMDRRDRGQILSCDVHPHKLKLIDSGAQRLGITSIRTALADAREEHAAWLEQADVVVADVPCSGLGIIRKKPDIRYKNPRDLAQLPAIQGDILENACRYVCPGGVLVYSTCTVLPEENQEIIHVFLSRHPEFRRETFTLPGPVGLCDGEATLWPQRLGTDGFYICRMRRKA